MQDKIINLILSLGYKFIDDNYGVNIQRYKYIKDDDKLYIFHRTKKIITIFDKNIITYTYNDFYSLFNNIERLKKIKKIKLFNGTSTNNI